MNKLDHIYFNKITNVFTCNICKKTQQLKKYFTYNEFKEFEAEHKNCVKIDLSNAVYHCSCGFSTADYIEYETHSLNHIKENCNKEMLSKFIGFLEEENIINDNNRDMFLSKLNEIL